MLRRFISKGTRMEHVSLSLIRRVQDWMNTLPRKILGYATLPVSVYLKRCRNLRSLPHELDDETPWHDGVWTVLWS